MKETKFKMTEAGMVPQEWKCVKLEDYFDLGNGYTPSKANPAFWTNGTIPWFRMEDIRTNGHILKDSIQHVTPQAVKASGLFPKYSIILSTTATIGEHALLIADSLANQRFTFLNRKVNRIDEVDIMYFYWHCYALGDWCRKNINAGGLLAVNMDDLKEYLLPLPPLSEQSRIASALSSIDNLLSSLDKLIAKKQAIKQGAMQQLLSGKTRLEGFKEAWVEKKVEDVVSRFATGLNPRQNFVLNTGGSNYYVTIKNFKEGKVYLDDECDKIDDNALHLINNRSDLRKGDLLLSSIGRVGDPCIVKEEPTNWNINESVFALRPNTEHITVDFLYYIFKSDSVQRKFNDSSTGSTLTSIKMGHLRELTIAIPSSLKEQRIIASILTSLENELESLKSKRLKYAAIKQGMMQQLLTGKIRLI